MTADHPYTFSSWSTSSYSSGGDNCVAVSLADGGAPVVGVRDSQHPDLTTLTLPAGEWVALRRAVTEGDWQ